MDTLTHSLLGGLSGQACFNKTSQYISRKEIFIVGAVAAAFPDIDYLLFWIDPLKFLADWHRAHTHSFIMLPFWAVLLGVSLAYLRRKRRCWKAYTFISAISLTSHICSDIITVYGTKIFSPVSAYALYIGTTFVIDGYFTAIILIGLVFLTVSQTDKKKIYPLATIFVLIGYCSFQFTLKQKAHNIAEIYASHRYNTSYEINTLPQPFSPFHWLLIIESEEQYSLAHIELSENKLFKEYTLSMVKLLTGFNESMTSLANQYSSEKEIKWQETSKKMVTENVLVATVWNHDKMEPFRRFARFPVLYRINHTEDENCVWFTDLRYVLPHLLPPFRYGMCRSTHSEWRLGRLIRHTDNTKEFF